MKKIKIFGLVTLAVAFLSGCVAQESSMTVKEREIIQVANDIISKKHDVKISIDDFTYSVGKQSGENQFTSLDSGAPLNKTTYENIVSVSALKKTIHKKGELYSYSIVYNMKTREVVSEKVNIG